MVGGVFGNTTGVAPGYLFTLSYKKLSLYSEGEFVFDTKHSDSNFFYSWNEFTYSPTDWLRFGLAAQRTRAYQTPLDVQRGFFAGVSYKRVDFTTYVFNAGWTDPTVVLAMTCSVRNSVRRGGVVRQGLERKFGVRRRDSKSF